MSSRTSAVAQNRSRKTISATGVMERKCDAFDQQYDRRSEPSPTIATIVSQTKQSLPYVRVTESPLGVGSEPTTESDSNRNHTRNLRRVKSRQQNEPKRRRVMEHKSDALEQPFDHRSEPFSHDSDNNLARIEDSTARSSYALTPAIEDISELESEPDSDHDTQIARHKKGRNPNYDRAISLGIQMITKNWDVGPAELEKILGKTPSRGIIDLAIEFSSLVKFDKAGPQLERAQNELG